MTPPEKPTHGGARKGSGRKPDSEHGTRVNITVRLLPENASHARHLAEKSGKSLSWVLDELLEHSRYLSETAALMVE